MKQDGVSPRKRETTFCNFLHFSPPKGSWPLPGSFGGVRILWGGCSSECWPLPASFGQLASSEEELLKGMKSRPLPPFISLFLESRSTRTYLHSVECLPVILKGCWPVPASFRVTVYSSYIVLEVLDARLCQHLTSLYRGIPGHCRGLSE